MSASTARSLRPFVSCLAAVALAACDSSDDDSGFVVVATDRAASGAPIVLAGDRMVYFASELFTGVTGTVLNSDGDKLDQVAVTVDLRARTETNLGVAAQGAAVLATEVYLVVDESADGVDWNVDLAQDDFVLLHWSAATGTPAFVDLVATGARLVVAGQRLYYTSQGAPLAVADETTLRSLSVAAPLVPEVVLSTAGGLARGNPIPVVRPLRQLSGLLVCAVDETADGTDYNADADALDDTVLVLLDASVAGAPLHNVALALADDAEPVTARMLGPSDWLVAFLVDEASQGGMNLNDQALFPSQPLLPENCLGTPDMDAIDRVLAYLEFADFAAGLTMPVNTGLAGHDRVLVLDGFVATLSDEGDANCNLNAGTGDTDMNDDVARWVATTLPVAPARAAEDLHALATGIGGGSMGLAVLSDRLVAVIDEAADDADFDTQGVETMADHTLVAWLDPADANPTWRFSHQSSSATIGTGVFDTDGDSEPFAGTNWMAAEAVGSRLPLVFLEDVPSATNPNLGSLNTNLSCDLVVKDTDEMDGLPVWADFADGPTLDFDGMGYALDLTNPGPGLEIAAGFAFFRVSEVADARDYNNDGQMNDVVLFRNPLTSCSPVPMATSSLIAGPVITTDRASGAAFFSSETQAGVDFNEDGDTNDVVVRYFRF